MALVELLFVGTQMPGAWRDEAFRVSQLPWQMTKVAHFVVFALMAALAHARPLCVPSGTGAAGRPGRADRGPAVLRLQP